MEKKTINLQQIKNRLLKMLSMRDHSVFEMKQKLKQYNLFESEDFDQAIEWIKKLGYLPDEKLLAQKWTTQWQKEGRSKRWIAGKLKTKGLKPVEGSNDEAELEAARVFVTRKLKNKEISSLSFQEKQKLMRQLANRGFSHSVVRDLVK